MMKATVTEVANDIVTLRFADGQTLRVPVSACEAAVSAGSETSVLVVPADKETAVRGTLARAIVNDIIGPEAS